jgi:NAD/NADP transhydrogenase beta subunit
MCENMGRNILSVIFGGAGTANPTSSPSGATIEGEITTASVDLMCEALLEAKNVIIVPGYGLAVAQAQFAVAEIVKVLRERYGKNVRFG